MGSNGFFLLFALTTLLFYTRCFMALPYLQPNAPMIACFVVPAISIPEPRSPALGRGRRGWGTDEKPTLADNHDAHLSQPLARFGGRVKGATLRVHLDP